MVHAATGIDKHLQIVTWDLHINPESDLNISSSRELSLLIWAYLTVTLKNVLYIKKETNKKLSTLAGGKRFNSFQTFSFNLCICFVLIFDLFVYLLT